MLTGRTQPISQNTNIGHWITRARIQIRMLGPLTLTTAHLTDTVANETALSQIAAINVTAPAQKFVDRAIQEHRGGGVTDDFPLTTAYLSNRPQQATQQPAPSPTVHPRKSRSNRPLKKPRRYARTRHRRRQGLSVHHPEPTCHYQRTPDPHQRDQQPTPTSNVDKLTASPAPDVLTTVAISEIQFIGNGRPRPTSDMTADPPRSRPGLEHE
jgi:hypothetical protein